jgi:DHA3 family macrolide efflux protein-like MFS transporter
VGPVLGALLLVTILIQGVILIDVVTFLYAILTLLRVRVPRPPTDAGVAKVSLLRDTTYGWSYILARPGLLNLLLFFAATNLMTGIFIVLAQPMVLSFATVPTLGTAMSIAASGMLIGGLIISLWGGPRRRILGVLGFEFLVGLGIAISGLRPSLPLFTAAAFLIFFSVPFMMGASQAIWQSKVMPDVQGRVFSVRQMIAQSSFPVAYLVAGPLATYCFEPLLAVGGPLARSVGHFIGVGPGRGIGLLFVVLGSLTMLVVVAFYLNPRLRLVEEELPDAIV